MEKRKTLIFNLLVCISVCYATYNLINEEIYVHRMFMESNTVVRELQNPLTKIFIGEGGRIYNYQTQFRGKSFMSCAMYVLLIFGVVRYYKSGKQKVRGLLYILLVHFFGYIAIISNAFFNICLKAIQKSNFSFQELNLGTKFWVEIFGFHFIGLIVLYFPIKYLIDVLKIFQNTGNQILPLKAMRLFHSLNDRMVIIILTNAPMWIYFLGPSKNSMMGTILFQLILVMSYFFTEWLFKISPAKALTGTQVIAFDTDNNQVTIGQICLRSISRLIPFESFSFLGQNGWHDRFSKTSLVYTDTENWLSRQSRIVKTASSCLNALAIWLFITSIVGLVARSGSFEQVTDLPLALTFIFLFMMSLLFMAWLSSISAFAQMQAYNEETGTGYNFLSVLSWWIPLLHFSAPSKTLSYIIDDFEKTVENKNLDDSILEKVRVTSKTLSTGFGFFYTCVLLSFLGFYLVNWYYENYIASLVLSLGTICFCFFVTNYANAIKDFSTHI